MRSASKNVLVFMSVFSLLFLVLLMLLLSLLVSTRLLFLVLLFQLVRYCLLQEFVAIGAKGHSGGDGIGRRVKRMSSMHLPAHEKPFCWQEINGPNPPIFQYNVFVFLSDLKLPSIRFKLETKYIYIYTILIFIAAIRRIGRTTEYAFLFSALSSGSRIDLAYVNTTGKRAHRRTAASGIHAFSFSSFFNNCFPFRIASLVGWSALGRKCLLMVITRIIVSLWFASIVGQWAQQRRSENMMKNKTANDKCEMSHWMRRSEIDETCHNMPVVRRVSVELNLRRTSDPFLWWTKQFFFPPCAAAVARFRSTLLQLRELVFFFLCLQK